MHKLNIKICNKRKYSIMLIQSRKPKKIQKFKNYWKKQETKIIKLYQVHQKNKLVLFIDKDIIPLIQILTFKEINNNNNIHLKEKCIKMKKIEC